MILTLSTTHRPATDLGFLLMKHPENVHEKDLPFGTATLFFPEANEARCTAALLLDIDPVALVRGKEAWSRGLFGHYVTDRPYAVSSFLSVAISRLLGTAMGGRSRARQALADKAIPLEATLTPLPVRGGERILKRLFEPLGYGVSAAPHPLDSTHPEWGDSVYVTAKLSATLRLADLLTHLFVLIPVLDNQKHYWVGADEVEKLLAKGRGWLEHHPEQDMIANRYLKHRSGLTRWALEALADRVAGPDVALEDAQDEKEETLERPISLNQQRQDAVTAALLESGATRIADLGCGEGNLLRHLLKQNQFRKIIGVDVSTRALERATKRLHLETMSDRQRARIDLIQGSLVYRDERLASLDAAALVEVIEHLEPDRLDALAASLFGQARPRTVVVTTPNREFNATFENLDPGAFRHADHRFEWTRAEFAVWGTTVARRYGYRVRVEGIGEEHPNFGQPTQMGVFER